MENKVNFSDYIVYVDESGDHGLKNINDGYPVFVLAFCIFHKKYYSKEVVPSLQQFKFKHFGHDIVVLHEHEIRKEKYPFNFFKSKSEKNDFLDELTGIIEQSNFVLACSVIEKTKLIEQFSEPENPYHLALNFGLERVYQFLQEKEQHKHTTHIVVESRGKNENKELELEFRRICDGNNKLKKELPFKLKFASKQVNSAGLQLSDLFARPVGVHVIKPEQENRAFEVLKDKFYCEGGRCNAGKNYEGFGLKRFP